MAELLSLEAARASVLAAIMPIADVGVVAPTDALGRTLAADVRAAADLPPWDNSSMDGYAIIAADVEAATNAAPVRLAVIGEVAAGDLSGQLVAPGTAIRIATGAPLPPGATAVVAVEETTPWDAAGTPGPRGRDAAGPLPAAIDVHEATPAAANIRRRASDIAAGVTVLHAGAAIGAAEIALAAAAHAAEIAVLRRPRVAVLSTGDELRAAGEPLGPAGIPDSNGPALLALARLAGAETVSLGISPDRFEPMLSLLRRGIADADLVIVSGGVSVGPYDVVKRAFEAVGRVELWRVAVQPGKPFTFGSAVAPDGRTVHLFGLPGNPVSSFVTFELFVRPALRRLAGRPDTALFRPLDRAILADATSTARGRRTFLRVVADRAADGSPVRDADGRTRVRLAGGQESHIISALAAADALAIVPESVGDQPAEGPVDLWWLDRP